MRFGTKSASKPTKVKTPKVPAPRSNPTGRVRPPLGFPRPPIARVKKSKTRDYGKLPDDGLSSGFGNTGMTGES